MKEEEIHKELESIAPNLAKLKKKGNPFKVPDNYFDQFEQQLSERLKEASPIRQETKVRQLTYWLSRAAAIAVLLLGFFYFIQKDATPKVDLLADVTPDEIHQYLADNIHELEEDLLFEPNVLNKDQLEDDFSKEEIDVYLEDQLYELEDSDLDNLL